jgi:hypothetical protein
MELSVRRLHLDLTGRLRNISARILLCICLANGLCTCLVKPVAAQHTPPPSQSTATQPNATQETAQQPAATSSSEAKPEQKAEKSEEKKDRKEDEHHRGAKRSSFCRT